MGTAKVDAAGTSLDRAATKAFEAQRDEAIAQVRQSVQGLLELIVQNFLIDEYKNRTCELDAEDAGLETEWRILSESREALAPITEAKVRVLQRLADDQMALGDTAESRQKQEEASGVQEKFDAVLDRIEQVHARRVAIVEAKRSIARGIFGEVYPSLPIASFAVIECALDILDGFRAGMFKYQTLTGLEPSSLRDRALVRSSHIEKLTPNGAVGRQLAYRLAEWFR
jgi:hypothetical protein